MQSPLGTDKKLQNRSTTTTDVTTTITDVTTTTTDVNKKENTF